ncbi:MAG: MFS transporter [Candidatus Hydrogenedentes bacterium]|nr:MFS transporter [Candidatus Hydrogenedentota bacterium]
MSSSDLQNGPVSDAESKRILRIVFFIVFLDMAGFSVIFPLFPSMLDYYIVREGTSGVFGAVVASLDSLRLWLGARPDQGHEIIFGGFLSALYALLQFICAPILGSLSDRIGRRPILLFSIAGIALSYGLWVFASTFAMLVASRLIGGLMSGNISAASAVIADITSDKNRSRGMAVLGFAIGVAFMFGPAIGGIASLFDPSEVWPSLEPYGINPYSAAAAASLLLAVANWIVVARGLPETLKPQTVSQRAPRPLNPFAMFAIKYPGVTRTNVTYFIFLLSFSGMMEFAITFLVKDRFHFHPGQIAVMFLFVGFVLAMAQGTYVRKRSGIIGPKRMSIHGLACIVPGLIIVGIAQSVWMLSIGLLLTTIGSAQVRPCMSALVSLYTPSNEQGRILGVFRSLEGLTRAISPVLACLLYWNLGAQNAYAIAALAVVTALGLAFTLPHPNYTT